MQLCRLLHSRGRTVLASVRRTSAELESVGVEVIEGERLALQEGSMFCARPGDCLSHRCSAGVDVANDDCVRPVVKALGSSQIDLLIVAAGCQTLDNIDTVTRDAVRQQFEVNAVGPLFAVKALRDKLAEGAKVHCGPKNPAQLFCQRRHISSAVLLA